MVDILSLEHLRAITSGDEALERELFALYDQTVEKCLGEMETALASGDDTLWTNATHELKGASANLGAKQLKDLCQAAHDAPPEERGGFLEQVRTGAEDVQALAGSLTY